MNTPALPETTYPRWIPMNAYQVLLHLNNLIRDKKKKIGWLLVVCLLVTIACRSAVSLETSSADLFPEEPTAINTVAAADTQVPVADFLGSDEGTNKPVATHTAFPIPSSTPEPTLTLVGEADEIEQIQESEPEPEPEPKRGPYWHLSIEHLLERSYGGGEVEVHQVMGRENGFTRYLISYPSDDLVIYGFANVPTTGSGPYPIIIALHGYVDPAVYRTLAYTTHYADTLAQADFIVLHPNLRNYPPSSSGENFFRVGMAIDVLNLIAIMEEQAGKPGLFENAIPNSIGLWGHSMGGGISLRVTVVNPSVRATVLYGAMSGDERRNFEAIYEWSDNHRGLEELAVPLEELDLIAPINFLDRIRASISVHHGEADQVVPLEWSLDLCRNLIELGMEPECFTYPGQRHTFNQTGNQVFMERVIDFYMRHLKQ
jgi:uncharacterized protein